MINMQSRGEKALYIILVLTVLILVLNIFSKDEEIVIEYSKITDENYLPEKILENMKQIEFKRGFWEFGGDFYETEDIYFVICGGEKYKDGYDVEIVDTRLYVNDSRRTPKWEAIEWARYTPIIIEKEIGHKSILNGITDYPIVVFRIETRFGENDILSASMNIYNKENPDTFSERIEKQYNFVQDASQR